MQAKIKLSNCDEVITVDAIDFNRLNSFCWVLKDRSIQICLGNKSISLGQFILNTSKTVDHKDRNIFNNRRYNLREANATQNAYNRGKKFGDYTSMFKGVYWRNDSKLWRAVITVNKSKINLGQFSSQEEAARAYDAAAIKYHQEFACLNFKDLKT